MPLEEDAALPLLHPSQTRACLSWKTLHEAYWNSGYACLCTTPFLLFLGNFTVASLTRSLPVLEVVMLRSMFVAVLAVLYQTWQKGRPQLALGSKPGLVVLHTIGALAANITAFAAISMIPLANALTLMYANIALTAVLCFIFGLETLRWFASVGIALCIAGIVFVVQPTFFFSVSDEETSSNRRLGIILAVLNGILGSLVLLLKRAIGTSVRPDVLLLYPILFVIFTAFVSLACHVPESPVYRLALWHWGLLALGGIASFLARVLLNRGVALLSGTLAAICASFQMLFALVSDLLLMNEAFSPNVLIGTVLMLSGSVATILSIQ